MEGRTVATMGPHTPRGKRRVLTHPNRPQRKRPMNGKTTAEGHGAKHWRRLAQEQDTPGEVAVKHTRLTEDVMGNTVIEKVEVRRLVFP